MKRESTVKEVMPCLGKMLLVLWVSMATANGQATHAPGAAGKFKAAVYAHAAVIPEDKTPVSRAKALKVMTENLAVYKEQTEEAHRQGVDILVFPEDGIYGMLFNRQTVYPYLEYMPDPNQETWIPCDEPDRYNNTEVQKELSCLAKDNQLYLVANIGDKQPCDPSTDESCPKDGRYQYNTDVAYGPDGTFLAKYHKLNLFFEDQFDFPAPQHVYFDTPFGRFGMMTCFDIIFREPAIPLLEEYNVTNFAFPTAWMDALPLLPAIGFHSSFARAHGVNFLAANIHLPQKRFDGSGLYAPDGALAFHYDSVKAGEGGPKLVVAEMDVIEKSTSKVRTQSTKEVGTAGISDDDSSSSAKFQSQLFGDVYTFRTLDESSGEISVCQSKTCCQLEYTIQAENTTQRELFAFGAFEGRHVKEGAYYMQNCALVKCRDAKNRSSCGRHVFDSSTVFTKISLRGEFQTPYVYPQLILSDSQGNLSVSEPGKWTFTGSAIETSDSFRGPVLNALLVARDYTKDKEPKTTDAGSSVATSFRLLHAVLFVSLLQYYLK
ncbi:pantetheinase [Elysia marginata]|uniref:Pantetheinase n=1 Tax=Elysia marginata TaxID=1093978 RepID=A0AAV4JQX6_9GAST|nr:pantetheinase [Elysia marginata]